MRKLRRRVITIRIETKKTCLICLAKKHTTVLDVGGLIFEKGKRYAVIGSNGSGKTTMLKIIGGLIKPDKNAIFETDFAGGGNTICYMSQTSYAFDMSLKRNVYVACPDLPRLKCRDTRLYYKNRCNDLIRDMGLWEQKRFETFRRRNPKNGFVPRLCRQARNPSS